MPFGRATFESKRRRLRGPIAAPKEDVVIGKVMPRFLLLERNRLHLRVIPGKRPEFFSVDLIERSKPGGDTLRLAALEALRQAVKQVVVGVKVSARMRARIF